jgi:glycosyltransferase involved in cell wall biosynthesis
MERVKPTVLVFVGQYLPGYKAGGILRSVNNMVSHLHGEFRFRIVTRDRDLSDDVEYPNIRHNEWQTVGDSEVFYLAPEKETLGNLGRVLCEVPHDLLYLNSFFEPLTVKILVNRKLGRIPLKPVLISPRGEFAWASLRLKYSKKMLFMKLARISRLYRPCTWHASSNFEADDIVRIMKIPRARIRVALDLPTIGKDVQPDSAAAGKDGKLRVVFLSRISPEKNLDFALRVLAGVRAKVIFDIVGPTENLAYWRKCEAMIPTLPSNVTVRGLGGIKPDLVMSTLANYDLLLFPSGGENYGHVIAEALTVGTPVLVSTNTPWRELEARGLGWDIPLETPDAFIRVVDTLGAASEKERLQLRQRVKQKMRQYLADPAVLDENRRLLCEVAAAGPAARPRLGMPEIAGIRAGAQPFPTTRPERDEA